MIINPWHFPDNCAWAEPAPEVLEKGVRQSCGETRGAARGEELSAGTRPSSLVAAGEPRLGRGHMGQGIRGVC